MSTLKALINPLVRVIRTYRDQYRRYRDQPLPAEIYQRNQPMRKISFCTTCMNRFFHLEKTFLKNVDDNSLYPNVEFVLVNYNSGDGLHAWAKRCLPVYIHKGIVNYYHTTEPKIFHASIAKNLAHKVATGDIVCNLDSDNFTGKDFAFYINYMFNQLGEDSLLHFKKAPYWGTEGRIVMFRNQFIQLGGYDESFEPIGHEDHDLINRAREFGLKYKNIQLENFLHYLSNSTYEKAVNCSPESVNYYDLQDRNKVRSNQNIAEKKLVANTGGWGMLPMYTNFSTEAKVFEVDLPSKIFHSRVASVGPTDVSS